MQLVLEALIAGPNVGILVPVPQYPLYSASISLLGGNLVSYPLSESSKGWTLDPDSIRESVKKARAQGLDVRAVCVINPGNPTGNCLRKEDVVKVLEIAREERLVVLADEVYQSGFGTLDVPCHARRADVCANPQQTRTSPPAPSSPSAKPSSN